MKLISIAAAARLLGVDPATLRRHETADGRWCQMYGCRFKVYRIDLTPNAQRRYNETEIHRILARLSRA